MNLFKIALGISLISTPSFAATNTCRYEVDPTTVKVGWTAFKTTEKTPVQGTLKDVQIKTPMKSVKNLVGLLARVKASGSVDSEKKSDSGKPERDHTLFEKFFSLISFHGKFEGSFVNIVGDEKAGTLDLSLIFNNKTKKVPMKYTLSAENALEVEGEFDLNNFGAEAPLASLHQACEQLHKGKDGVSKTWPNVGLKISAKITKDCK